MRELERVSAILKTIPKRGRFWIRQAKVKTIEIHVENGTNMISINPYFVKKLSDYEIEIILQHEIEHINRKHSQRCKKLVTLLSGAEIHRMFNVAADLEINQGRPVLDMMIKVGKGKFKNTQKGLTAEQYFVCVLHSRLCRNTQTRKA